MALLCAALCANSYAADEGFNAALDIETGENCISVTIADSNVLADKQPTLLINCGAEFDGALLLFDGKASELEYDTEKLGVSFTVAKGGTYHIVKGLTPSSSTAATCAEDGSATFDYMAGSYVMTIKATGSHDFTDTTKATCANCSEPNPNYVEPTPTPPVIIPSIPSEPPEPSEPVGPEEPADEPCDGGVDCPASALSDVNTSKWYHEAIDFALENGIMQGVGGGRFDPDGTTTRAMVWTMLARLNGVDTASGTNWYEAGQKWAMEKGISDGTDPTAKVTREQLVTMIWRYLGKPESDHDISNYVDHHETSDWALEAKQWAVETGVIKGLSDTILAPGGDATRAQVAQIFMNFLNT